MAHLPTNSEDTEAATPEAPKPRIGEDDMVSGISSFGNEAPAADDTEAVQKERDIFRRLEPVLELLNNVIAEHYDEVTSIKTLIIGPPDAQPDPQKVLIELRARELHLDFLEKFKSRIQNTQNTIEELRTNG